MKSFNQFSKSISSIITVTALSFLAGVTQAGAESLPYEGTATLCFVGGTPPEVDQKGKGGVTYVSNSVSLYHMQTNNDLVDGWEVLTSDMKVTKKVYWLSWTGVLTPTYYPGSTLEETASIKTKDLSTLSGTWQGTGDLEGTSVDYVLVVNPTATPVCPTEQPPQCADIVGGCVPAALVTTPIVYDMSGFVNAE